jgi:flagellar hook-associated protein 3 FlgL
MRISTSWLYQSGLNGILGQQSSLAETQLQLATGKRINNPSDDPVGAARLQDIQRGVAQQDVFIDNIGRARQRLAAEETTLSSVGNTVQRVRELAVQAASDSVDDGSRAMIATELRQRVDELVALANSQDGDGQFMFAGSRSGARPFVASGDTVAYAGDGVRRELTIGPGTTIADGDTGDAVFMRIRDGNGTVEARADAGNTGSGVIELGSTTDPTAWTGDSYTLEFTAADAWEVRDSGGAVVASGAYEAGAEIAFSGVSLAVSGAPDAGDEFTVAPAGNISLFDTVIDLAEVLEQAPATEAQRTQRRQVIEDSLVRLDNVENHLLQFQADIGGRLNTLDDFEEAQEDVKLGLQSLASEIRDLDYAQAISRMQQQMVALEAAQQSYVRIQGLSLFDYIR